jgi:hypothetical protein
MSETIERPRLLGDRLTLEDIAADLGCCERAARNLMDRLAVPYTKVLNARRYDREAVKTAILGGDVNRFPRGRGRPRKAAA